MRRVAWAVAAGLVGYLVVYPAIEMLIARASPPVSGAVEDLSIGERIQIRAMQAFAAVWSFALGASVGSFLNVLVYRQPRGLSVLTAPSQCPACGTRLGRGENIPVLGWLRLGGRCRTCAAPISPRYPIVEAIAGALFAALVFLELTSGGANLPVRRPNGYAGFVWTVFYPKWDLIALTVYHFHLLAMLLTWTLMAIDRVRIPLRSIATSFVLAAAAPLAWTKLAIVPPGLVGTAGYPQPLPVVAASLGLGLGIGLVLAAIAAAARLAPFRTAAAMLGLIGLTLGWQATVTIGGVSLIVAGIRKGSGAAHVGLPATLLIVAAMHQALWRPLFAALWSWTLE